MTEVTEIRCCKHWMQGKLARADDKCPWCEIDKLQEDDKRGREMTDYDHGYSDGYQQARADLLRIVCAEIEQREQGNDK